MNTLVLLVQRGSAWSPENWTTEHGGVRRADGQITLEREDGWLSVVRDDRILTEFEEEERSRFEELVNDPIAYLVEWKGNLLVETLLRSVPPETRVAVDNDHGLLVPVYEVAGEPLDSWVRASRLP